MSVPRFDCPLCLKPCLQRLGPGRFELREHAIGFTDSRGKHWDAPIATGTDGGSVPWITQPVVGDEIDSDALPGYVLHDRAYQSAPASQTGLLAAIFSRERYEADRMLREAATAAGVSHDEAREIYRGVRWGGWRSWRRHARENAARANGVNLKVNS